MLQKKLAPIVFVLLLSSTAAALGMNNDIADTSLKTNPGAPAAPLDFTAAHNGDELKATLSWTNPIVTVDGASLSGLDSIIVFRGDRRIGTLTDAAPGEKSFFKDYSITSAGLYKYRIVAHIGSISGEPGVASAWIGLDVPGEPGKVAAAHSSGSASEYTIEWTPPTAGANGGHWKSASWEGQNLRRNGSLIACLTGNNLRYVDNAPNVNHLIYEISYFNSSGEGLKARVVPVPANTDDFTAIPYDWVEIRSVGINTGIHGDDQNLGPFTIGFSVPWYDNQQYNSIRVCSNGWCSFTSTSSAYSNYSIPTTSEPNNLISPYWDDLYPPAGGNIWYYSDVVNDRFIVEFDGVPHISGSQPYYFEAIIYSNGLVDFMYNTLGEIRNSCTVGIENSSGTVGIQTTHNGSGPLEPQNQTGIRITAPFVVTSDLIVTIIPQFPPIVIPAGGGYFSFDVEVLNTTNGLMGFDAWIYVILPNTHIYGPLVTRSNLRIASGQTITRGMTQFVPTIAPAGSYDYIAAVGTYPGVLIDEDTLTFTKLGGDGAENHTQGWTVSGWFGGDISQIENHKSQITNLDLYPNPFNAATALSFEMRAASVVSLSVYDVNGREVAALAEGWRPAGSHHFAFDGSDLASGIYFAVLRIESAVDTRKLLLLK